MSVFFALLKPDPHQPRQLTKTLHSSSKSSLGNLVKETKSYILDYVLETSYPRENTSFRDESKQKLSIQEAKKRGILNVEKGLYIDQKNNACLPIDEAIRLGLIGARVTICEKNYVSEEDKEKEEPTKATNNLATNYESCTSTLTIDSVLDSASSRFVSISDAIKMGILDQSNLSYVDTASGKVMSLNEAFMNGRVKGNQFHESQNSQSPMEDEACYKIKTFLNPLTHAHMTLDEAIQQGFFDKERGLFTNPATGQKMNLNEAFSKGLLQTEAKSAPNKANVLVIDVVKEDAKKDTLLYQVNEIEEFKFEVNKNGPPIGTEAMTISQSKISLDNRRVEEVIEDDEDEDGEENDELVKPPINMRKRSTRKFASATNSGLKPNIQERRIRESICGSADVGANETLIIDDVRQSMALDIDGITHVLKNEFVIDCDYATQGKNDNTLSSCISSLSSSPSKNSIVSSSSENSNLKKLANSTTPTATTNTNNHRTVIVVDDQLINYGKQQQKQSPGKSDSPQNQSSPNETLKIDVRKSADEKSARQHMDENRNSSSSTEFLSNSERAQFERVNTKKTRAKLSVSRPFTITAVLFFYF